MLNKINKLLSKNYISISITIAIIILFAYLSHHIYMNYIAPRINKIYTENNEFTKISNKNNSEVELYYFYTTWCPHCKKSRPIIDKLSKYLENNKINGVTVLVRNIDCDKDETTANKFNVKGYPTIKLVKNNKIYHYEANPDIDTLKLFLKTYT